MASQGDIIVENVWGGKIACQVMICFARSAAINFPCFVLSVRRSGKCVLNVKVLRFRKGLPLSISGAVRGAEALAQRHLVPGVQGVNPLWF